MKKVRILLSAIVIGALLFALTACGGAKGALSSFVSAAKRLDFDKASEYCMDGSLLKESGDMTEAAASLSVYIDATTEDLTDFYEDMMKDCLREFKYSVDSSTESEDGKEITLEITYSNINVMELMTKYGVSLGMEIISGGKVSLETAKTKFDAELKTAKSAEKKENTATIKVVQDEEENWKLESGVAVLALMMAGSAG